MLDLAVWTTRGAGGADGGDQIRHTFFSKPSASPKVFHGKGAYPWRLKLITLAEEVTRRMVNMDRGHTMDERLAVMNKFCTMMKDSHYNTKSRWQIIYSGLVKYYRMLAVQSMGGRRINRSAAEMKGARTLKQLNNRTWFRNKKGGQDAKEKKETPWLTEERIHMNKREEESREGRGERGGRDKEKKKGGRGESGEKEREPAGAEMKTEKVTTDQGHEVVKSSEQEEDNRLPGGAARPRHDDVKSIDRFPGGAARPSHDDVKSFEESNEDEHVVGGDPVRGSPQNPPTRRLI